METRRAELKKFLQNSEIQSYLDKLQHSIVSEDRLSLDRVFKLKKDTFHVVHKVTLVVTNEVGSIQQ
jgi:predicted solute-binding protein